jgi:flagellar protein FlgJ
MKIDGFGSILQSYSNQISSVAKQGETKDFSSIMANEVKSREKEQLYKSCQELESVFVNKVLDAMRSTVSSSGLFEKSFATETWESMLYQEYAKKMSQTGSLGLADIIYKQLSQNI